MAEGYPHLDWKPTSWPGVELVFLESFDDGSARVLIRMAPGREYPRHRHVGEEQVFVVSGGYSDAAGDYGAGSFQRFAAASVHAPVAGADGAVLLAWAAQGIELLEDPPGER